MSTQFPGNPQRLDPYKNFKFLIEFDGIPVAGVSKMSMLKRTTEVVKHRSGGDSSSSHKSPGRTEYEPITFERGLTHDKEFQLWANKVWNYGSGVGSEMSLKKFRKDISVKVLNEAGQIVLIYNVYRCWVSSYQSLPELDANGNGIAIENIVVENEGWELDDQFEAKEEQDI
jgi:phage tail-like protein